MRLRDNPNHRIGGNAADCGRRQLPKMLALLAEKRQHFGEDFFGGDHRHALQTAADARCSRMTLVLVVDDRDPIMRVGENPPHGLGTLRRTMEVVVKLLRSVFGQLRQLFRRHAPAQLVHHFPDRFIAGDGLDLTCR